MYENWFYMLMFAGHLILGVVMLLPFMLFMFIHLFNTRLRKNKRAIRVGYALMIASLVLLGSGILLMRFDIGGNNSVLVIKNAATRSLIYWAHVGSPFFCLWLYWLHRLAGPKIKWKLGAGYLAAVAVIGGAFIAMHNQDPRKWNEAGPKEGEKIFLPITRENVDGQFHSGRITDE